MPILSNPRHERFAQELAKGKSQTEAYLAAGYNTSEIAARSSASDLLTNPNISARVAELQGRAAEGVVLTRQWVIERLILNVDRAMQVEEVRDSEGEPTGEYRYEGSVANRALELLGKEQGMFVERRDTKLTVTDAFNDMSTDELRELLAAARAVENESGEGDAGNDGPEPGLANPTAH